MNKFFDENALARYLAGACSEREKASIEARLETDAELREVVNMLRRVWHTPAEHPYADLPSVDASWERMRRRIEQAPADARFEEPPRPRDRRAVKRPGGRRSLYAVSERWPLRAAALAVVVLLAVLAGHLTTQDTPSSAAPPAMRELATARAQRATITLGEGTRIILNAESRLRFPEVFESDSREVTLEGEAYFEVAHDPGRPFVVHAAAGRVEVLGTTFSTRAYPDDSVVQVVVAEGRVALAPHTVHRPIHRPMTSERLVLSPGERGRLGREGRLVADEVDAATYTSWTEGRLVFERTPLGDVARTLERWYDVEVELRGDALMRKTFTADLKGKYLHDVLDVLSASVKLTYEITDDRVVLSLDAPSAPSPR